MQYIPLIDFFGFLGKSVKVYSSEELNHLSIEIIEKYQQGFFISIENKTIKQEQAIAFCLKLNHPGIVVFDQWICQNKNLYQLLTMQKLAKNNFDQKIIDQHVLFGGFTDFLSPFLLPSLLQVMESKNDLQFLTSATYISILNTDCQILLQEQLTTWLKSQLSNLQDKTRNANSEQKLIEAISPLLNDETIDFVNCFTKAFYASKINFVDQFLSTINHPYCSPRLGAWIVNQLKNISLNPEHLAEVEEITSNITTGKKRFTNQQGHIKFDFQSFRNFYWVFIGLTLAGLVYLFWFNPLNFWNDVPILTDNKSSLESFTKQERMQIDSLVKASQTTDNEEVVPIGNDQFIHLPPVEMNSIYRIPFQNKTAEQFYEDCLKDEMMVEKGLIDTCVPYANKNLSLKINPNFKSLALHRGTKPVFIQNESNYQILILVFNDLTSIVHSTVIQMDEKLNFTMSPGEIVLFLPGNEWAAFEAEKTNLTEMPTANYKNHFCMQDENFKAMLYSPYRLKNTNEKIVKLMFNESTQNGEKFILLDLFEALENY